MQKFLSNLKVICLSISLVFSISLVQSQSQLSIEEIMQGYDFIGHSPSGVSWSPDGKKIRFSWNPENEKLSSGFSMVLPNLSPEKMSLEDDDNWLWNYAYNSKRDRITYQKNGDIFFSDTEGKDVLRITNTINSESSPSFVDNDRKILFSMNDNYFTWEIATGIIHQLTNFQNGTKKEKRPDPENDIWIENEQMELINVLKARDEMDELRKERREKVKEDRPEAIYLGKKRMLSKSLSPGMRFVTYSLQSSPDSKSTKVPIFVAENAYVDIRNGRSKVGSPQGSMEFFIYDLELDTSYKFKTDEIEGIFDKPEFLKDYHDEGEYKDQYEKARDVFIHGPIYNDENGEALIVVRSLDNKDRWIMSLDLETGTAKLLDRQRDEAWVGGPGVGGWNFSTGNIGWIDADRFYYQSEQSGFSHLFIMNTKTGKKNQITNGNWEVRSAWLNLKKDQFYMISNEEEPGQQQFYSMDLDGKKKKRLSKKEGAYQIFMSPDEQEIFARYSFQNQPWELYYFDSEKDEEVRITKSTSTEFDDYEWRAPGLIKFKARDGAMVTARLYKNEKTAKGGPAIIFVHGAGYLQNAHKWWSSYYREYMFHNYLVDQGYTVLDIDYRASDGYGRDWRTAIYRHMGGWDLTDQIDGAKYLIDEHGIDEDRIGIYGGSYGGFITLMGLFTSPGTFKCGAALRSVTDWAHYNHGYTSNILNTPVEDPEAFRKSSPIYFAENLEDHLLILHGMVDSNVQFQDVVRLAQRLIELGKNDWEFAVFPVEGHGFVESTSWADEYKRIFKLFETNLK